LLFTTGEHRVASSDRHVPRRAREILEHYLANPRATDSLEGIATWRLLEDFVQRRVKETHRALRWLVARGFLTRSTDQSASPPLYQLNPDKRAEAIRLLSDAAAGREVRSVED
jgi:hypothetical protein